MKHTIQQIIAAALDARGETRLMGRSRKYLEYTHRYTSMRSPYGSLVPHVGELKSFYFIGKNGALRLGRNISTSRSIEGIRRDALIAEGKQVLSTAATRQKGQQNGKETNP